MATKTQPPASPSRLSLFGFTSFSRNATSTRPPSRSNSQEQDDDWYIPYNGPVEQPARAGGSKDRDSWGDALHGWISESTDDSHPHGEDGGRGARSSRSRAMSNASQLTTSSSLRSYHPRNVAQPRSLAPSFVDLDKAGGVGASPMPTDRISQFGSPTPASPHPPLPTNNRASLISILTFGRKSLRHSPSLDQLPQERSLGRRRGNTSASTTTPPGSAPPPRPRPSDLPADSSPKPNEDNEYYYSSLFVHSSTRGVPNRQSPFGSHASDSANSHPYATTSSSIVRAPPRSAPAVPLKGKTRFLDPGKLSITLLDPRGPKVPSYLKPSPRNSVLKTSLSTPNLRDIPRGKQRWLSAETWCDALILPRPRFAMRLMDGGPSGRIVSPPGSPVSSHDAKLPLSGTRTESAQLRGAKQLKKAKSAGNLFGAALGAGSREAEKSAGVTLEGKGKEKDLGKTEGVSHRPQSWALDDLAVPTPVPSLSHVVAEGEKLNAEREEWKSQATQSFQNKRLRRARSRSKSLGHSQTRQRTLSFSGQAAFELLAERTLHGNQSRPPTIHVHPPPPLKSPRTSSSGDHRRSYSSHQIGVPPAVARARSHTISNSATQSSHRPTLSGSTTHGHSHGHGRSQSLGIALKMVKSTAAGAASLCGLNANATDRSPLVGGAEDRRYEDDTANTTSPSTALALVTQHPDGRATVSPTPSGMSTSAEGIGIAISDSIAMPSHPYAQGSGYRRQQSARHIAPEIAVTDSGIQMSTGSGGSPHRQPITHLYPHLAHPYAAAMAQAKSRPQPLDTTLASQSLYAELTPGIIREFDPKDIQYSPLDQDGKAPLASAPPRHPYAPSPARFSEIAFGDALVRTLRNQSSMDSGLGTSEAGGPDHGLVPNPTMEVSPPVDLQSPDSDDVNNNQTYQESPHDTYQRSAAASSQALGSLENTPAFRRRGSFGMRHHLPVGTPQGQSSGSSPGMVSRTSSPPLSPRPLPVPGDLDRFRDLFYRPAVDAADPQSPSTDSSQRRQNSGSSIPLDVSSRASRSISGLTNLARQLSEDLEELRELERDAGLIVGDVSPGDTDRGGSSSPMWGRRYGGLRGTRPEDMDDPNVVLLHSQVSSDSGSPGGGSTLPLRIHSDTPFSGPIANFPEDIGVDEMESSRASSILEGSTFHEDPTNYLRVGEVSGLSPDIVPNPRRESTRLSVIGDQEDIPNITSDCPAELERDHVSPLRVPSQYSNTISPLTADNLARSSYMTTMTMSTDPSRMSGLSDFPAPPTTSQSIITFVPSSTSSQSPAPTASMNTTEVAYPSSNSRSRPAQLLREASKDTFGVYRHEYDAHIGEVL